MKKKTNTTKAISAALLTVSAISFVIGYLNTRKAKEELNDHVMTVWNRINKDVVNDLRLKQCPEIEFTKEEKDACMYVSNSIKYNMFTMIIQEVTPIYKIFVNEETLRRTVNHYQSMLPIRSKELTDLIIKQMLMHECRHIWQNQEGVLVGDKVQLFSFDFNGYGNDPNELDANQWANNNADTIKELAIGQLMKKDQELAGVLIQSETAKEEIKFFYKNFLPTLYHLFTCFSK